MPNNRLTSAQLKKDLLALKNPEKAKIFQGFFKTGKGEYGEGDVFLGITVPIQRSVAKKYLALSLAEIEKLLRSNIHEFRFTALEIAVMKFEKGNAKEQKQIFDWYLKNSKWINNWDLVDASAPYIVGEFLSNKPRKILYKLAASKNLWERRIAIVSTFAFIRHGELTDTFKISETLLQDTHDLIHKAVGWMLREAGKRDEKALLRFLQTHRHGMPRTMLRYAIERFPQTTRRKLLFVPKLD